MTRPPGPAGPQIPARATTDLPMMTPASASRSPRPLRASAAGWCRADLEVLDARWRGGLVPTPHRVSRAAARTAARLASALARRAPRRGPTGVDPPAGHPAAHGTKHHRAAAAVRPRQRAAGLTAGLPERRLPVSNAARADVVHLPDGAAGRPPQPTVTAVPAVAPSSAAGDRGRPQMDSDEQRRLHQLADLAAGLAGLGWVVRLELAGPLPSDCGCVLVLCRQPGRASYLLAPADGHHVHVWAGRDSTGAWLGTATGADDVHDRIRRHHADTSPRAPRPPAPVSLGQPAVDLAVTS